MKQSLTGAVVLVSLMAGACAGPGVTGRAPPLAETPAATTKPPVSPAEARESLRAADASLAEALRQKGVSEGLTASVAGDAVLLLAGRYALRGTEAIRTGLAAEPLVKAGVQSAEAVVWNVSADGQMGYALGHILLREAKAGAMEAPSTAAPGASGAARASGTTGASAAPGSAEATSTAAPGASVAPSAKEPAQRYLRYLAVWTRTPESPWRLVAMTLGRPTGPLQVPPTFSVVPTDARADTQRARADTLAEAFAADAAFSDQSTREGMGIAFGAWAAPDGVTPNGPSGNFGRDAIVSGYAPQTRDKVDLRWEPRLGGAASSGDLAYTVGRAVAVAPGPDGRPGTHYTKYLSVWRRQPDGQWRYVADAGNGNPGPDGP